MWAGALVQVAGRANRARRKERVRRAVSKLSVVRASRLSMAQVDTADTIMAAMQRVTTTPRFATQVKDALSGKVLPIVVFITFIGIGVTFAMVFRLLCLFVDWCLIHRFV